MIINHNALKSVNTFNSNLKKGDVNPLLRKSYKQLLNINSRFRNNYTITSASNYGFTLPSPIKKIVSMKIVDMQIPKVIYTVSSMLGSNKFVITDSTTTSTIEIPSGSYNGHDITATINISLTTAGFATIYSSFSTITGLITFTDLSSNPFKLDFSYDDASCNQFTQTGSNLYKDQLTLGWLLGFRSNYKYLTPQIARPETATVPLNNKNIKSVSRIHNRRPVLTQVKNNGYQYLEQQLECCPQQVYPMDISYNYSGKTFYTAEAVYDYQGSRYFLLSVNDFQNNHNISVISPLQEETLGDGNILAKISSECGCNCCGDNIERIYFGPTDINKLQLTLYDEFGRIVDLNNGDYSVTLELEVLYDL